MYYLLYFVPDGTGKYEFCSRDTELQKWCEATKNKRVKANALKFVVGGAKDYLKGKTQLKDTSTSVKANWKDNPVGTLQNVLEAKGEMLQYSEPEEGWLGGIGITLSVDGYEDITKFAQNQKEARKACAIAFAEENLGIDVEKEAQKVTETPKPQQTQQKQQPQSSKLPQTFAVSPDNEKLWIDVNGRPALFKKTQIRDNGTHTNAHYGEAFVSEMCQLLNYECAEVEIAERNGEIGCISYSFLKEDDELVDFITNCKISRWVNDNSL